MVAPRPGNKAPAFGGKSGSAPKAGSTSAPMPGGGGSNALSGFFSDIDFESIESFAQLTPGMHLGRVKSAVPGYSKNGNEQLEVTFSIVGGPNDGRSTKYWLVKTPNTLWKVDQFLASLGYDKSEMRAANPTNMKDRLTVLVVALDDYRNDGSTRVINTLPYDEERGFEQAEEVTEEDV